MISTKRAVMTVDEAAPLVAALIESGGRGQDDDAGPRKSRSRVLSAGSGGGAEFDAEVKRIAGAAAALLQHAAGGSSAPLRHSSRALAVARPSYRGLDEGGQEGDEVSSGEAGDSEEESRSAAEVSQASAVASAMLAGSGSVQQPSQLPVGQPRRRGRPRIHPIAPVAVADRGGVQLQPRPTLSAEFTGGGADSDDEDNASGSEGLARVSQGHDSDAGVSGSDSSIEDGDDDDSSASASGSGAKRKWQKLSRDAAVAGGRGVHFSAALVHSSSSGKARPPTYHKQRQLAAAALEARQSGGRGPPPLEVPRAPSSAHLSLTAGSAAPILDVDYPLASPIYTLASVIDGKGYAARGSASSSAGIGSAPVERHTSGQRSPPAPMSLLLPPRLADPDALATSPHLSDLHNGEPTPHFGLPTRDASGLGAIASAAGVGDGGRVGFGLRQLLPSMPPSPLNSMRITQLPSISSIASGALTSSLSGSRSAERESFEIGPTPQARTLAMATTAATGSSVSLSSVARG